MMPILAPNFWHKNEKLVFAIITLVSIFSSCVLINNPTEIMKQAIIDDYIPFIITLFTVYTLSHGINIKLIACPSTLANIIFLGICSVFASIIGTTGAAMLFLRPFLEMNRERQTKTHLVIFFIFLVANIGGLLTPLGDPPLLLGYLHGVDFLWGLKNTFFYWLGYVGIALGILYFIDNFILKKNGTILEKTKISIDISGWLNVALIISTVVVLFSNINFNFFGVPQIFIKNAILLIFCGISIYKRKTQHEKKIDFEPFKEVVRTFFVIFIVIAPVLFILESNSAEIQKLITNLSNGKDSTLVYFWLCSIASSFLDNAPSYLLFFNMAGGNANELMHTYPSILKAISVSSVVMGSMTYIGNAPNMMIKSIAIKQGIKMPSFIGYMAWSCIIILPISFLMVFIMSR